MSDLDDLIASIPVGQIADQLGVDRAAAQKAVTGAVEALTGGLQVNASKDGGAQSLVDALSTKDLGFLDGLSLDQIDLADGQKILGHIFGDKTDSIAAALSGSTDAQHAAAPGAGSGSGLIQKVLPLIAPIVLAWLAKKTAGQSGGAVSKDSGGIVQDILGQLTGGGSAGAGGGIGDLLGQILKGR
ncbi:MAG: DUF937 domain-containing protein [Aeromicrobium sp.]|uniref:DUF937 domain-containing protein n=1 Tax=Aeromicrobium sp. TaxID=1871063 RepID=UPI0039E4C22A